MKVSPSFDIREFVPKAIWDQFGPRSRIFVDPHLVEGMEYLRGLYSEHFGDIRVVVNDWLWGGKLENRGFRPPATTVGGRLSQHRFGRAGDHHLVKGSKIIPASEVCALIVDQWPKIQRNTFFTTMEDPAFTATWTHIDGRWTGVDTLTIVKP